MALDERSRHSLHARLEEILGEDEAATLMEYLPPVGWADVVTNRSLDLRLESLENRITSTMNEKFVEMQRHFIMAVVTSMATLTLSVAGLAFAAAKLF